MTQAPPSPSVPARRPSGAGAPSVPALRGRLTLETPLGAVLSDSRIRLLEAIERCGSLNRAAKEVPLSYKAAWDALDAMNKLAPDPLVERSTGGSGGGGTRLTDHARQLIALYRAMESSQQDILDRLEVPPSEHDPAELRTLIRRLTMKTSARNQFAARVSALADRGGLVDVTLALGDAPGRVDRMVATITPESVRTMDLTLGSDVFALVKAPAVTVSATAPEPEEGHNALRGTVGALKPGERSTGVRLDLPSGLALQAVVESTQGQAFSVGQTAWAGFSGDQVVLVTFG